MLDVYQDLAADGKGGMREGEVLGVQHPSEPSLSFRFPLTKPVTVTSPIL